MRLALKYKFLAVLLSTLGTAFAIFFYLVQKNFSEDKKLFVMDLNISVLKSALSEVKLELRGRMEELQILIPKIYSSSDNSENSDDPFLGLPSRLKQEVLSVQFFEAAPESGTLVPKKSFFNNSLLETKGLDHESFATLNEENPLPATSFFTHEGIELRNRSHRFTSSKVVDLPILTILFSGKFLSGDSKNIVIAVDLLQDFLRNSLEQSELAELFLISKDGKIISHPKVSEMVEYANKAYPHPITERLQTKQFPRESLELRVNGEDYLCNLSNTEFGNVFAVSQIRKSHAFQALSLMLRQTLEIMAFIFFVSLVVSIVFASRLTSNISKLREATQKIGSGDLSLTLKIKSGDEVEELAESFQSMAGKLTDLISQSAQKARMEEELETARLVQSTLLTPPSINTDSAEILPFYQSATECGGDFCDAFVNQNSLTLIIGDATGHGVPAAIVTAVAKSCIATMSRIFNKQDVLPNHFLWMLNNIIYNSCRGKLLMTMCVAHLDLRTGMLSIANASHESPLLLKAGTKPGKKGITESLFVRGERLGYEPNTQYELIHRTISVGDTLLFYSDGISEAPNRTGKVWGERALKNAFAANGSRSLQLIRNDLVSLLQKHTEGTPQSDDISFLLVKWKKALEVSNHRSQEKAA